MFVKTVDNRYARPGLGLNWTLAAYEEDVARTHKALVGCQRGWDRYLDAHLGVMVDSSLDLAGSRLCAAGVGFHAHPDSGNAYHGSVWTAGTQQGLGLELQGLIDYSYYNASELGAMNYCSPTTEGRCYAGSGCTNDDGGDDDDGAFLHEGVIDMLANRAATRRR